MTPPTPDLSALITKLEEMQRTYEKAEQIAGRPGSYLAMDELILENKKTLLSLARWSLVAKEALEELPSQLRIAMPEVIKGKTFRIAYQLSGKALSSFPSSK